jgi:hypothetical protein
MTRRRRDVDDGGERSERWQIERRGEEGPTAMVGKTGTTIETGSVEDLEVLPPNPLEDATTVIPGLEAQETAHHHIEIARTGMLDYQEKALQHR